MEISQSRGGNRATRYANRIALYTPSWIVIGCRKNSQPSTSPFDSSSVPLAVPLPSMSHRVIRDKLSSCPPEIDGCYRRYHRSIVIVLSCVKKLASKKRRRASDRGKRGGGRRRGGKKPSFRFLKSSFLVSYRIMLFTIQLSFEFFNAICIIL